MRLLGEKYMLTLNEVTEKESLELMSLINRVDNYLGTRKTRSLLKSEITTQSIEIGFIRDRDNLLKTQLDEVTREIESRRPILTDLKNKLSVLEPELKAAETEYLNLKQMQDEIESKQTIIEQRKTAVTLLNKEIENITAILDKVNREYDGALNRKAEIDQEKSTFDLRKSNLEEEIKVMKNTDELLKGIIPDDLNADVFAGVVNNIEALVKKYVEEIQFTIETIESDISRKRFDIENKDSERDALLSQKDELLGEIEILEPFRLSDDQKEKVLEDINKLRDKADEISNIIEKKESDFQHIEYELMEVEESLQSERDFESEYFDRYAFLNQLKKDMSQLRDINAEMERLNDETKSLRVKENVNRKALNDTTSVNDEAENINQAINSTINEYKEIFAELDSLLKG